MNSIRKFFGVVDPRWWFVCVIKSNNEMAFRRHLSKFSILNFCPIKTIQISVFEKKINRRVPLFPNYVFVYGDHYQQFRRKTDWKGLLGVINEDDEKVYKLNHQIVYTLMIEQALGVFDRNKNNDVNNKFEIGDIVDVVCEVDPEPPLYEKSEYIMVRDATIISVGSKRATLVSAKSIFKIKLCLLRKSVDKFRPPGKPSLKAAASRRTSP